MRAGRLRHCFYIEEVSELEDTYGDVVETWTTFAVVRGSFRFLRGTELFAAQQITAETTAEIRIRYISGLNEKMRIRDRDEVFNITYIDNVARMGRELRILVSIGLRD